MKTQTWLVALALSLVFWGTGSAETPAQKLEVVADDLDRTAAELEVAEAATQRLKERLLTLETLANDHQQTVRTQGDLLADYRSAVEALEAHDRASLALAQDLRGQLEAERAIGRWLWPVAGTAVAIAVVEAVLLGLRR